ncbi:MAG: carboxylating nicotinate-nucleotide diphosphorylase [Immundisolibacter sp.]|uniref:carboxylating nicotinate-nucleotide diphosphorylase n=1 Tax=Immundisolibacter sp. TaxID=1934948 RepID=UPI0019B142E5|nr:carboxylating nicotinate-nucleotide diphosphorylase [Immundisolibacter sp.]MBC7162177.1 carboxylating nicotinate-nucleotide diphosphorylase [Immundisolibacter sp.]
MHPDANTLAAIPGQVRAALDEDIGTGDLTAALVPENVAASARVVCRDQAVLCGQAWFDAVFKALDPRVEITWQTRDGYDLSAGQTLCQVRGPARAILTGERCALNFLQTLSGTATTTRAYVAAIAGMHTKLLDTRKTLPGLRLAQKYAVHVGGALNHRKGLYDAILIKENHIALAGSISAAIEAARRLAPPNTPVEVEVENLDQLRSALAAGVKQILLDNFPLELMREAVKLAADKATVEASGGVGIEGLRAIAATGVDFISVGALTKHVHAVDLSLRVDELGPAS